MRHTLGALRDRVMTLYRVRAHVHHYTEHIDQEMIDEAIERVENLAARYDELEGHASHPVAPPRPGGTGPPRWAPAF